MFPENIPFKSKKKQQQHAGKEHLFFCLSKTFFSKFSPLMENNNNIKKETKVSFIKKKTKHKNISIKKQQKKSCLNVLFFVLFCSLQT